MKISVNRSVTMKVNEIFNPVYNRSGEIIKRAACLLFLFQKCNLHIQGSNFHLKYFKSNGIFTPIRHVIITEMRGTPADLRRTQYAEGWASITIDFIFFRQFRLCLRKRFPWHLEWKSNRFRSLHGRAMLLFTVDTMCWSFQTNSLVCALKWWFTKISLAKSDKLIEIVNASMAWTFFRILSRDLWDAFISTFEQSFFFQIYNGPCRNLGP